MFEIISSHEAYEEENYSAKASYQCDDDATVSDVMQAVESAGVFATYQIESFLRYYATRLGIDYDKIDEIREKYPASDDDEFDVNIDFYKESEDADSEEF